MLRGDLGFTPEDLIALATNPIQYDAPTGWDGQGASPETLARVDHYLDYLGPFTEQWRT